MPFYSPETEVVLLLGHTRRLAETLLYRLAHYPSMSVFAETSLYAIKDCLRPSNVSRELFGDVARVSPEVESAVIEFTASHWDGVQFSKELG